MRLSILVFCTLCLCLCVAILVIRVHFPFGHIINSRSIGLNSPLPFTSGNVTKTFTKSDDGRFIPPTATNDVDVSVLEKDILDALSSDDPSGQIMVFTNQLLELIKVNPREAARFSDTVKPEYLRGAVMRIVAENWAKLNPTDAVEWTSQLRDSDERDTMLGCVCFQIAQTNPQLAVQSVEQQSYVDERQKILLGIMAQDWALKDTQAAVSWAMNYPSGQDRDNLFMNIAIGISKVDPIQATRIIAGQIPPGPIQEEAALSVVQQWAIRDPAAAASWANEFPSGELRDKAISQITLTPVQ